jgi:hypothetical protein
VNKEENRQMLKKLWDEGNISLREGPSGGRDGLYEHIAAAYPFSARRGLDLDVLIEHRIKGHYSDNQNDVPPKFPA